MIRGTVTFKMPSFNAKFPRNQSRESTPSSKIPPKQTTRLGRQRWPPYKIIDPELHFIQLLLIRLSWFNCKTVVSGERLPSLSFGYLSLVWVEWEKTAKKVINKLNKLGHLWTDLRNKWRIASHRYLWGLSESWAVKVLSIKM